MTLQDIIVFYCSGPRIAALVLCVSVAETREGEREEDEITGDLLCTPHSLTPRFCFVFSNPQNKNDTKNLFSLLYFYNFINATKHYTLIL